MGKLYYDNNTINQEKMGTLCQHIVTKIHKYKHLFKYNEHAGTSISTLTHASACKNYAALLTLQYMTEIY